MFAVPGSSSVIVSDGPETGNVLTVTLRVPAALVFPAASRAVAESVSVPCPIAVMSAATSV